MGGRAGGGQVCVGGQCGPAQGGGRGPRMNFGYADPARLSPPENPMESGRNPLDRSGEPGYINRRKPASGLALVGNPPEDRAEPEPPQASPMPHHNQILVFRDTPSPLGSGSFGTPPPDTPITVGGAFGGPLRPGDPVAPPTPEGPPGVGQPPAPNQNFAISSPRMRAGVQLPLDQVPRGRMM